jgi:hypothetical protein
MHTLTPEITRPEISRYVPEQQDAFLSLFPHRFDYIWAAHPESGDKVAWQTESRHPLSDRQIRQGSHLYGVRFGPETHYCLLDIDVGSAFHPGRDRFALSRILATLEPLGLVAAIACTSSYSRGLHVYLPLREGQKSWELALVVATVLENAGFKLSPGQLELFPNPKPYSPDGHPSLFNAHRLPLQMGSYLLNDQLEPIWSDEHNFVQQWHMAADRNDLDVRAFQKMLHQSKRKSYRVSGKGDKFLQDLNTEIALGWTGFGQTNYLLGRITLRTYIFHAVLTGEAPLTGQPLVQEVVRIARSLPGYSEWCRHQQDIEARAAEWAVCVEGSRYFPYGTGQGKFKAKGAVAESQSSDKSSEQQRPSWNQVQAEGARDRIRQAIAQLLDTNSWPVNATARFQALTQHGVGGGSLYRHRDLWHPKHLLNADNPDLAAYPVPALAAHSVPAYEPHPASKSHVTEASVTETLITKAHLSEPYLSETYTAEIPAVKLEENQMEQPQLKSPKSVEFQSRVFDYAVGASNTSPSTSLLSNTGRNQLASPCFRVQKSVETTALGDNDCDDCDDISAFISTSNSSASSYVSDEGIHSVIQVINSVKDWLTEQQTAAKRSIAEYKDRQEARHQAKREASQQAHRLRMQQFLVSGDPILVAEARNWLAMNPEFLEECGSFA